MLKLFKEEMIAITVVFYLLATVASKTTFKFPQSRQMPFTSFKRWMTIEAGKNDMSFYFKTTQRKAFLFYEQHYDSSTSILGELDNGKVKLTVRMSNHDECNRGSVSIPEEKNLADFKWHKVVIQFDTVYVKLQVDSYATKKIRCKDTVIASKKTIRTDVFVGALKCDSNTIDPDLCIFIKKTRFVGCIGNVQIADRMGKIVDARIRNPFNLTTDCSGVCTPSSCENSGRCLDRAVKYECDCRGTGYNGATCDVEAASVWLNGTGYILKTEVKGNSYLNDYLSFRFNSSAPDGTILHTLTGNKDIFILELINGTLVMQIDLGGGKLILKAGDGTLHDGNWHSVLLERKQHRVTYKVDGKRYRQKAITKGGNPFTELNFSPNTSAIYFGGIPKTDLSPLSLAKKNFSGILQQLVFRDIDILHEALSGSCDNDIVSYGTVLNASEFINFEEFEGSGNCSNFDDEDDCETKPATDETEQVTTKEPTTTATRTFAQLPATLSIPTSNVLAQTARRVHSVSAWVIIAIVVAAIAAIVVTVFVVYYWNNRYSGSFKPKENNTSVHPSSEKQENTRGYEQPAFYVSSKKVENNQPFNKV